MTGSEIGLAWQTDKPAGRYGELAATAEALGFDVVSVFADLLYQPPLPALVEMARATSRVRPGAACLNPYTQHPYEIASGLAVLDAVAPGRAYLGLARGAWLDAIGVAQPRPLAHLRDAAAVVRALLSGDARGYAGAVFRLAPGGRLRGSRPARVPPLLLGAWGPRGAALAGEVFDEIKVGGSANPAVAALVRDRVRAAALAAGRPGDGPGGAGGGDGGGPGRRRGAAAGADRGGQVPGGGGGAGRGHRAAGGVRGKGTRAGRGGAGGGGGVAHPGRGAGPVRVLGDAGAGGGAGAAGAGRGGGTGRVRWAARADGRERRGAAGA